MTQASVFPRKLLFVFVAVAIGAFVLSLYLMSREDYGADQTGTSSYSASAIGYAGIAGLLSSLGIPVIKSNSQSVKKAQDGLLIIAEPQLSLLPQTTIPVLPSARKTLLILPKWSGTAGGERRNWIRRASLQSAFQVTRTLQLVSDKAEIARVDGAEKWSINEIAAEPLAPGSLQLMKSQDLRPLVASDDGILLGEVRRDGRPIWVLSDPDVIANHSFEANGKGSVFPVRMIERLRGGEGPVVFDETVHGFASRPAAAARLLFEFPYNIITVQIAIGIALLLWATMGRFGPPQASPPPLFAGKAALVGNVAHLMEFAGYERLMIDRYVEAVIRDTARKLRAPKRAAVPGADRLAETAR